MARLEVVDESGLLAHGVHLSMVALGITGLTVILLPQLIERFRRIEATPRDAHEARVRQLRAQLSAPLSAPHSARQFSELAVPEVISPTAAESTAEARLLPYLLVAGLASASAHAAVAPPHLLDNVLFGAFFMLCAVAQLSWVVALMSGTTRAMLHWAILGNLAVLLLWATTRLWGLPFGLMPEPEALGPWDVTCALWEVVIIAGALRLLREPRQGHRPPALFDWPPAANAWLGGSVVVLVLLAFSGAHS